MIPLVAVAVALVVWIVRDQLLRALIGTPKIHLSLVHDRHGSEALVVDVKMGDGRWMLFQLDTAYAGAPVLSTFYLRRGGALVRGGVQRRYQQIAADTRARRSEGEGVRSFLARCATCRTFTAGCTVRLASIGAVKEHQADLILAPALALDGKTIDFESDVLVTHELPHSPHILTMDYLLHRAPAMILPARGCLRLRVPPLEMAALRATMVTWPLHLSDGAPCIPMEVDGVTLQIVLDTGAAAPLSLNAQAAVKNAADDAAAERKVVQTGVNGERVCSDVRYATVRLHKDLDLGRVQVMVNRTATQGADGYAGMGLLRALDLLFEPDCIGARRSGLETRDLPPQLARPGRCDGA